MVVPERNLFSLERLPVSTVLPLESGREVMGPGCSNECQGIGLPVRIPQGGLAGFTYLSVHLREGTSHMLSHLAAPVVSFLKDESGPTAVEYAVMLALIIVVCITAITTLGTNANNTFSYVGNKIAGSGS